MMIDGALLFSNKQTLTALVAGTPTASTNSIDFSQSRDLGVTEPLKLFVVCPTLPVSSTNGATLLVTLQGSNDGATWTTIEDSGAVPLASITGNNAYLWRTQLPIFGTLWRYLQLTYTASAALTTGTIEAGINLDVNRHPAYPRNYAA